MSEQRTTPAQYHEAEALLWRLYRQGISLYTRQERLFAQPVELVDPFTAERLWAYRQSLRVMAAAVRVPATDEEAVEITPPEEG